MTVKQEGEKFYFSLFNWGWDIEDGFMAQKKEF